jgi:hypothetical protein
MLNSLAGNSLQFATLYLQLIGWTNFYASVFIGLYYVGIAAGGVLGGERARLSSASLVMIAMCGAG